MLSGASGKLMRLGAGFAKGGGSCCLVRPEGEMEIMGAVSSGDELPRRLVFDLVVRCALRNEVRDRRVTVGKRHVVICVAVAGDSVCTPGTCR